MLSDNFNYENSLRDSNHMNELEDVNEMRKRIQSNDKAIHEFEGHLRSLLAIAKETEIDYAYQIKMGIEKIKFLVEDNVISKRMLLKEYKRGEEIQKEIDALTNEIEKNNHIMQSNNDQKGKMIVEKYQLLNNLGTITNEIDKYSEINNNYIKALQAKERPNKYVKLLEEIEKLKKENMRLRIIVEKIELNKAFDFDQDNQIKSSLFSCMGKTADSAFSLNLH